MVNNLPKGRLMRRTLPGRHLLGRIDPQGLFREEFAAHQLVGGVTDHQGYDGYPG
jgi:hypothetical protein